MITSKNIKIFSQSLLLALLYVVLAGPNQAYSLGDPHVQAPSEDKIAIEVAKIQSLDEANEALEKAQLTARSYRTSLRQLYKQSNEWDPQSFRKAVEGTEELIQDEERKISLLTAKIEKLEAE